MKRSSLLIICCLIASCVISGQVTGGEIKRNKKITTVKERRAPNLPPNSVKLDDGTIVQYETTKSVDLGLPSGTIWAGWNIGANSPLEVGSYYAWGETEEKEEYDWNTYFDIESIQTTIFGEYDNPKFKKYHVNGVMSIIGTDQDVSHIKWGEPWQMPSKKQLEELMNCCKVSTVILPNKIWVVIFTGPNGKF